MDRAGDRILWSARLAELPLGAVIVHAGHPHLVTDGDIRAFEFEGWGPPVEHDRTSVFDVLTPPTSVAALRHGFRPRLHPTALRPRAGGTGEDPADGRD
jgi:hypothetical protein